MDFVAIDFETATSDRNSACSVGIVVVSDGKIVDEYYSLIKPPGNYYDWRTIRVHGIKPKQTESAPKFAKVYPELKKRMAGNIIIAHNEAFDRSVLQSSMKYIKKPYGELHIADKWICTSEVFKARGYASTKLSKLCELFDIELQHHDALSDARATALLYLKR